jgi:hypothetical protein
MNWIIEQMWVKPQEAGKTDVVVTAAWRCNGQDAEFSGTVYGTCGFTVPEGDFTPYDKLTEAQVLDWCWASGVDKAEVEANVAQQIVDQKNPPVVQPTLPWAA